MSILPRHTGFAPPTIACFGAINQDIKATALGPVALGTSNPAAATRSDGGVARNVAENLAHLGATVHLVSRVGNDATGRGLLTRLHQASVAVDRVDLADDTPTASYTALLEPTGDLAVAFADMAVVDGITPATIDTAAAALPDCAAWFVDANLPVAALATAIDRAPTGTLLAADTVSVAKAGRLGPHLHRLDVLFTNMAELAALTGRPVNAPLEVVTAAATLRDRGVGRVVVALGPTGVFLATGGYEDFQPALPADVRDVTGAGDSLVAATLFGLAQGDTLPSALTLGLAAAAFTVEVEATVHPNLTVAGLRERSAWLQVA